MNDGERVETIKDAHRLRRNWIRVGAAAALLRLGDEAHWVTVRIAAEACAEPKTRQALLELVEAEGDEHKLELALARVR